MTQRSDSIVAVTGGSGFIGRAVVDGLLESGFGVRALSRRDDASASLRKQGVGVVRGGLDDPLALAALVEGVDAVVHMAGAVKGARYKDFETTNVDGSRTLLQAMAGSSTPLLALSSLAARKPGLSFYAQSKATMEALFHNHTERVVAILRPPPVYGPGDRALAPLFAAMAWGVAPMPVDPESRVSLLYVDDLAAAVRAWLRTAGRVGGTYTLHDGTPNGYSWEDIIRIIETKRRGPIRRLRVPSPLLTGSAWINQWLGRRLGFAPMLTPGKVRELRHPDWVCDNINWCRAVDWQPAVDLAEGFARLRGH